MIEVLRLSHRIRRDIRVTTHVCLVARAFGAQKVWYSGDRDSKLEENIKNIVTPLSGHRCNFVHLHHIYTFIIILSECQLQFPTIVQTSIQNLAIIDLRRYVMY